MERICRPVSFADLSSASDDFSYMGGSDDSTERRNLSDQNWIQITNNRNSNAAHQQQQQHKRIILFNPASLENIALINRLCEIEHSIIERYINTYCPFKTASYILKNQLMNGTVKYHSENIHIRNREIGPPSTVLYPFITGRGERDYLNGTYSHSQLSHETDAQRLGLPTLGRSSHLSSHFSLRESYDFKRFGVSRTLAHKDDASYATSVMSSHSLCLRNCPKDRFILKISGVWETATNVGITMKFILVR
jgi:hypothetical protein